MHWIGVGLDRDRNQTKGPVISSSSSAVTVFVIPTKEELMIARHTARVLAFGDQARLERQRYGKVRTGWPGRGAFSVETD